MTPGTVVLLHAPLDSAAAWADLPALLGSSGLDVIALDLPGGEGIRYVAQAALALAATDPRPPLLLVGHGGAGPLLPALAAAQRAARRPVGGYLFLDADLPAARNLDHDHGHDRPRVPGDWPDAPCGYLWASGSHEGQARVAGLRGWPVVRFSGGSLAEAVRLLIDDL